MLWLPYNLLPEGGKAAYVESGVWANKALKEAKNFGEVAIVATSKESNFTYIPKDFDHPGGCSLLPHYIKQYHLRYANAYVRSLNHLYLWCVICHQIYSAAKVNVADFGLIYAGAQKNMGPAGVTLVIVKDDILGKTGRKIPAMLSYQTQIEGGSMYNTPPVFAIYVSMLTLNWLKSKGGVEAIEKGKRCKAKSAVLYEEIERNPLFKPVLRYRRPFRHERLFRGKQP